MRFPSIFDYCQSVGLDMGKDLLPVTPAEHFICGGVKSDDHAQTSVKSLRQPATHGRSTHLKTGEKRVTDSGTF